MEIQDSFWQILSPESQEINFTATKVKSEDYGINGDGEDAPMIEVNF